MAKAPSIRTFTPEERVRLLIASGVASPMAVDHDGRDEDRPLVTLFLHAIYGGYNDRGGEDEYRRMGADFGPTL
jgi:hypothetical protein